MEESVRLLLGGPSGGFFYHLLVLFSIEVGLALSYGAYRRSSDAKELALVWAWGLMLAFRTAVVALAFFAWVGNTALEGSFWPVERLLDTATIFLLVWGFVAAPQLAGRGLWIALVGGVAASLGLAVLGHPAINLLLAETRWAWFQVFMLAVGMLLVWRLDEERWSILGFLSVLLAGVALQMVLAPGGEGAPIWERLGHLVGFPLAAVTTYGFTLTRRSQATAEVVQERNGANGETVPLLAFFEALHQDESNPELSAVLERLTEGIARSLNADECAIVLTEDEAPDSLRLGAIYNAERTGQGEVVTFPVTEQQVLQSVLHQQQPVSIHNVEDAVQLQVLLALMGARESGPLLILPLMLEKENPGAIMVGRTRSLEPFDEEEVELGIQLAEYTSPRVRAAQQYGRRDQQISVLRAELRSRDEELEGHQSESRKRISRSRAEADLFAQRLRELEKELKEREEMLEGARTEIAQRISDARESREEADALSRKLGEAIRERMEVEERLRAVESNQQGEVGAGDQPSA